MLRNVTIYLIDFEIQLWTGDEEIEPEILRSYNWSMVILNRVLEISHPSKGVKLRERFSQNIEIPLHQNFFFFYFE